MDKTEIYEFASVIAPGAVTIFGLSRIYPEIGLLINDEKISFGEFGLLLILAYVTGHLIQAFGNLVEWAWRRCLGRGAIGLAAFTRAPPFSTATSTRAGK